MKFLGIVIVIFLIAAYFVWHFLKKPFAHRVAVGEDLSRFFKALLYRGYDKGFLIIEAGSKNRFIQFSKYLRSIKGPGLQFHFPNASWSAKYYDVLQARLASVNFPFELVTEAKDSAREAHVNVFIHIDLNQDLTAACRLTDLILSDVFEMKPGEKLTIYLQGVSPLEEKIGFHN